VVVATAGDPGRAGALSNVTIKPMSPANVEPPKTVTKPVDPAEAATLMQRGRDFMGAGDISAARIAFNRLADAGLADAALALANTYDPTYLAAHHVMGVQGDRATARTWYERAKELGSSQAAQMLTRMTGK
jgi:TPR repeat protein